MKSTTICLPAALLLLASDLQGNLPFRPAEGFTVQRHRAAAATLTRLVVGPLRVSTLVAPEDLFTTTAGCSSPLLLEDNSDVATAAEDRLPPLQDRSRRLPLSSLLNRYKSFAHSFPLPNNMMIAALKASTADVFAQLAVAHTALPELDLSRTCLFCAFGALYQGGFQYLYQVNLFSKLFTNVEQFTCQPWQQKIRDVDGLRTLAVQVVLDLIVMASVYLPTYYAFKAGMFSGGGEDGTIVMDPTFWFQDGLATYASHLDRDLTDLLRVWLPTDLICFSAPLVLRLPLRQFVSLFYTAYLSSQFLVS